MDTNIQDLRNELVPSRANQQVAPMSSGMGVEAERALAQVQAGYIMAWRRPRDEGLATTKIMEACQLVPVAEGSFFSFPRGGSVITGASIDLLKICARYWGNIDFSVQELERQVGQSVAIAIAIDLETNTRASRTFIVPHIRDRNDESGNEAGKALTTARDIYEVIANMGSRRLRSCLEDLIPPHIVGKAFQTCQETLRKAAEQTPLIDRLKQLVPAFKDLGVTEGMLVKFIGGRPLPEMLEQEYIKLRNIYTSIKSGAQRAEDFFKPQTVAESTASNKANVKKQDPAKADPVIKDGKVVEKAEDKKPEETGPPGFDELKAKIVAAASHDDLNTFQFLVKNGKFNKAQTAELKSLAVARAKELNAAPAQQTAGEREPGSDDDKGGGAPE